jgi:hypothetical protein
MFFGLLKNGIKMINNKTNHCKICNKCILPNSTYCRKHADKQHSINMQGKNNPNFKGKGNRIRDKKYFCKECNEEVNFNSTLYGSGLCKSCSFKKIYSIPENCSFFGKHHSKETKEKIGMVHKGKQLSIETKEKISKTRIERGVAKLELNPNWLEGVSFAPYSTKWNSELKESIRDRDNHECQICHKKEKDLNIKLCIHHIDYDKQNCEDTNLISLCKICHTTTNFNRDYYYAYFSTLMLSCSSL